MGHRNNGSSYAIGTMEHGTEITFEANRRPEAILGNRELNKLSIGGTGEQET